jgi:hypothetical protein
MSGSEEEEREKTARDTHEGIEEKPFFFFKKDNYLMIWLKKMSRGRGL